MKKSVYIETSIPSYLTARPSRDIRAAAWQQITNQWWDEAREYYELFTSELVIAEASDGHPEAAARRLASLEGIADILTMPPGNPLSAPFAFPQDTPILKSAHPWSFYRRRTMKYSDEIISEVWKNRDAYAARHHNRLHEMVADLRERQKRPGCKLVDRRGLNAGQHLGQIHDVVNTAPP